MSYFLPKRISEFATIDSDLDTPDKRDENGYKSAYRLPKRTADLNIQESDSEDDRNDKLNCAILNDSFILSPTKKLDLGPDTPPGKTSNSKDENHRNLHEKDSGIGTEPIVIRNFSENNHEDHLKMSYRPLKSRTQLFPSKLVLHERTQEPSIPSVFQKSEKDEPEPAVSEIVENVNTMELIQKIPVVNETETPFKKTDQLHVFATPSLRPTTFSSTTSNTNFTRQPLTCERKDKPKVKILFTTPIARPPPGSLLETTPIDTRKGALQTLRKLSPIKEPSAEKENSNERLLSINNVDYVIGRKIGSGGSSSVFLGRGKNSGKECAIKLVNLDGDQQVIDGYLNETKLLAKLQGNVSVVSLFDYCHLPKKNILYMVMEKGESDLHKILQAFTTHIPLYTLMNYWYQMLAAVHYIHLNGVIHSDLKPANFLMIGGRLKLIDFGIASNIALDSTSIIKFSQAGTFNYISPEALIDTSTGDSPSTHHQPRIRLSTKSDVWSLGCIFYLLLFKKTPFSHIKVLHHKITALTNPNTKIEFPSMPNFYPPILLEMVQKCLVYNPKERSSVADLLKFPFNMIIPIEK